MTAVWEVTQLALWIKGMKNGWWKEDILETQGKTFEALGYSFKLLSTGYSLYIFYFSF